MARTIEDDVLTLLRSYRKQGITALDALRWCGTMRLAAYIYNLKKRGHTIRTEMVNVTTASGRDVKVARYWLTDGE